MREQDAPATFNLMALRDRRTRRMLTAAVVIFLSQTAPRMGEIF
jgi:hypothetical protein